MPCIPLAENKSFNFSLSVAIDVSVKTELNDAVSLESDIASKILGYTL